MIAGRLTMRADVERDQAAGTDDWGQPVPADYQPLATLRCFVWSKNSREVVDGKVAMVEDLRAIFALDADIRGDDEIAQVTGRAGTVLISGRLRIEGPVQRKHTHQEAALRRLD